MTDLSTDAELLQREMRAVRSNLGDDVDRLVESARTITDWHFYIRRAPLLFLGAAAALGFWIVPSKNKKLSAQQDLSQLSAEQLADLIKYRSLLKEEPAAKPSDGLVSGLGKTALNALWRTGMALIAQQAKQYVKRAAAEALAPHPNGEVKPHDQH